MSYPPMGYSGCHGDENTIDIEPFMESALEEVVEAIMLFGEYPQPRPMSHMVSRLPRQFDLAGFLAEKNVIDQTELEEYFVLSIVDYDDIGTFEYQRNRYRKQIENRLKEELRGSEIVREKAEKLAQGD